MLFALIMTDRVENGHILHSSMFNSTLREWNTINTNITTKNLMYPIFIM